MAVNFLYGSTGGKKEQDDRSVYIRVNYNKLNWKKSLSMPISKKEWDFKKKSLVNLYTGIRSEERSEYLQEVLDKMTDLDKKFNQYLRELKTTGRFATIETVDFRKECEAIFNGETNRTKEERPTLTGIIEDFIGLRLKKEKDKPNSTTRTYISRSKVIQKYMKEVVKRELYTDEIDLNFYNDFQEWCYDNYKPNTFGSYIRLIKAALRHFRKFGVPVHFHIEDKDFRDIKEDVDRITLNEDEVERLFSYEGKESLETVRDTAKVLYYGCMRYSDFAKTMNEVDLLNVYKKKGVLHWDVKQQKTNDFKPIPMLEPIREMYDSKSFPKVYTNVHVNSLLKELCEAVGIKKPVCSHDFRRSYVTNEMYKEDAKPNEVRKMSGHKNWNSFDTYCKNNNIDRD